MDQKYRPMVLLDVKNPPKCVRRVGASYEAWKQFTGFVFYS